jgi:sensor histidine kinase YesM
VFPLKGDGKFWRWAIIRRLLITSFFWGVPFIWFGVPENHDVPAVLMSLWAVNILVTTPVSWLIFRQWKDKILQMKGLETALGQSEADLQFLKAQINPHFLFNTLNNIYALASAQSDHTAAAVMKLSSIMRYVLTEAKNDLVPLEKEILFTSHYIELQKMRLTDKTKIDFVINGDPLGREIAPLLLLPFVENAFKYGVSTRECSPISILLEIKEESLFFSISNHKHINTSLRMADNTGIGINNTRRRLDLLYPGKYDLIINDKSNEFTVHLNIPV